MTHRILDVGQCNPDHTSISRFLSSNFDVEIVRTHLPDDTLKALRGGSFDLVLINRKLDQDYSEGMDILKTIKADDALSGVPVMIVSNYEDAQAAAVEAGAVPGFGKSELSSSKAKERVADALGIGAAD